MSIGKQLSSILAWSGLIAAPAVWATNMQLGQILPYSDCTSPTNSSLWISLSFVAVALAAATLSWFRSGSDDAPGIGPAGTYRFAARVSALAALVFLFALAMHAAASMVLSGCQR